MRRRDIQRVAAPAAFLAVVTIAVLLVRAGLHHGGTAHTTTRSVRTAPHQASVPATTAAGTAPATKAQYYNVQSGDTYSTIASRFGTSVAQLELLNPGVSSTALRIGQRIRVK
jgi:LysM repeat protein